MSEIRFERLSFRKLDRSCPIEETTQNSKCEPGGRLMSSRAAAVIFGIFFFGLFLVTNGCKSGDSNAPPNASAPTGSSPATATSPAASAPAAPPASEVKAKVDVCALLTSDDLKGVQGEALKEA